MEQGCVMPVIAAHAGFLRQCNQESRTAPYRYPCSFPTPGPKADPVPETATDWGLCSIRSTIGSKPCPLRLKNSASLRAFVGPFVVMV
jgi:hypothetical protein